MKLLLFLLILWSFFPRIWAAYDKIYQYCESPLHGTYLKIPEYDICKKSDPKVVRFANISLYVPSTSIRTTPAVRCSKLYTTFYNTNSLFGSGPVRRHYISVTPEECEKWHQNRTADGLEFVDVGDGTFITDRPFNPPFEIFAERHTILNYVMVKGVVGTRDGHYVTSNLEDIAKCTPYDASCTRAGFVVIWNVTGLTNVNRHVLRGVFRAKIDEETVVIEQLQAAFSFTHKNTYAKRHFGKNAFQLDNDAVLVIHNSKILSRYRRDTDKLQSWYSNFPDIDPNAKEANARINYAGRKLHEQFIQELNNVAMTVCTLENHQTAVSYAFLAIDPTEGARLMTGVEDLSARFAGEVLMVHNCKPIVVIHQFKENKIGGICFKYQPVVTAENTTMFVVPGTKDLVYTSPEMSCTELVSNVIKDGDEYKKDGKAVIVETEPRTSFFTSDSGEFIRFNVPAVIKTEVQGIYSTITMMENYEERVRNLERVFGNRDTGDFMAAANQSSMQHIEAWLGKLRKLLKQYKMLVKEDEKRQSCDTCVVLSRNGPYDHSNHGHQSSSPVHVRRREERAPGPLVERNAMLHKANYPEYLEPERNASCSPEPWSHEEKPVDSQNRIGQDSSDGPTPCIQCATMENDSSDSGSVCSDYYDLWQHSLYPDAEHEARDVIHRFTDRFICFEIEVNGRVSTAAFDTNCEYSYCRVSLIGTLNATATVSHALITKTFEKSTMEYNRSVDVLLKLHNRLIPQTLMIQEDIACPRAEVMLGKDVQLHLKPISLDLTTGIIKFGNDIVPFKIEPCVYCHREECQCWKTFAEDTKSDDLSEGLKPHSQHQSTKILCSLCKKQPCECSTAKAPPHKAVQGSSQPNHRPPNPSNHIPEAAGSNDQLSNAPAPNSGSAVSTTDEKKSQKPKITFRSIFAKATSSFSEAVRPKSKSKEPKEPPLPSAPLAKPEQDEEDDQEDLDELIVWMTICNDCQQPKCVCDKQSLISEYSIVDMPPILMDLEEPSAENLDFVEKFQKELDNCDLIKIDEVPLHPRNSLRTRSVDEPPTSSDSDSSDSDAKSCGPNLHVIEPTDNRHLSHFASNPTLFASAHFNDGLVKFQSLPNFSNQ
ncbi:hypothetical protein L596_006375 [Steinernema carpocapsae]|uniref:VWFD domain-containing protein n=1 Tax=Steinernema carpocapsae TaxID=34508 RepID=A0A4U8V402_STECR|nr:hypothetical protein L596_006375 [Steinernema carpocapsae]